MIATVERYDCKIIGRTSINYAPEYLATTYLAIKHKFWTASSGPALFRLQQGQKFYTCYCVTGSNPYFYTSGITWYFTPVVFGARKDS
jgi:hypothetical protein